MYLEKSRDMWNDRCGDGEGDCHSLKDGAEGSGLSGWVDGIPLTETREAIGL